jgi:MYXO-CTERM domain-containing protein
MRISLLTAMALAAATLVITPKTADAGIEACGDIYLAAGAECELVAPGASCATQCTPISVEVSCAAQLQVECSVECTGSASVECTGSCQGGCEAQCNVDPGSFECATYCTADCAAGCEATCSDSQCNSTCEANCSASCDTDCKVVPAQADCKASCEGSCSGSCTADSTFTCQNACSASGYAGCTTDLTGGCETDCMATEGALFCDGQYVDVEGDLDACVNALRDALSIEVTGYADLECQGGSCQAEAGASCSVSGSTEEALGSLGLLMLALFLATRTRASGQTGVKE